jgi:myo-inositol-1(or 4)-monophosphatase
MRDADKTLLARIEQIVRQAMAMARAASLQQTQKKAHQDFVTNVDLEVDRFLKARLGALIVDCPVLSEERAVEHRTALQQYWIVDPIDGTLNMMSGLPFYGIAVALVDARGPQIAVVGAVAQDEVYSAIRGAGAWKDGAALALTGRAPDLVVLSTGLLDRLVDRHSEIYRALRKVGKFRNLGAQALHLCGVAQGSFAGVASIEARIWDEAAAGLIAREAGGVWRSRADRQDWTLPAVLMAVTEQRSIAAHPDAAVHLEQILAPVMG